MKFIPVNLSSPVLPLISSCLVYWCTFVSGTFFPDPFSACLRTQPVSAFLSGASPACCLGRWTHWEPEVRGNLKQKAFWKFSCRYFFSFKFIFFLGFVVNILIFIYFFCFKLLLIATKVLVEFADILCHVFWVSCSVYFRWSYIFFLDKWINNRK